MRKATKNDIIGIDRCNRVVLPENYTKQIYDYIFDGNYSSFVVEDEENIVAYIIVIILDNIVGHIISIGVLPEYQKRGYGTLLLETVEKDIRDKYQIKYMKLNVRKTNKIAQKLYIKLGYGRSKKIKKYYEDKEDAYLMIKKF